ncbi:CCN family member 2-like isoform X1 [Pristis pectinata]|uniref:CCN family member 2-like isoform X1 n=2 Tax=Pristis pectinata TaxID=685728 RepID=UPI00223DA547|nr:CCN family member 2-like isoform X1 [Pristis pectinata]
MRNHWVNTALTLYILCNAYKVDAQLCPYPCRCPRMPPRCAPGSSLVVDPCGCCRVCAKQLGEQCTRSDVCDPEQDLFCDYTVSYSWNRGICTSLESGTCEFNGVLYKDGDVFQPSCKYHCWCSDGGIGCIPRCSEDIRLPGPDCPYPKRVEIPGECCPRWICEKQDNGIFGDALAAFRSDVFARRYPSHVPFNCLEQSSEWSACSRSCGIGVSTRISNKNHRCILETQSQLCIVKPCQQDHVRQAHMGRNICQPTTRALRPIHFEYNNCISVKTYRPIYCGSCSDSRCCTPYKTRTESIEFKCKHGRIVKQQMMFIITCACHYNCSHAYK